MKYIYAKVRRRAYGSVRDYKSVSSGGLHTPTLRAIIQWRGTLERVVNVELNARRTCVRERGGRDAVLDGGLVMRRRMVVGVVVVVLGGRGRDRREHMGWSAGPCPRQFRKVGKHGRALARVSMDFVWARRRRLDDHGHRGLCGIAVVG